MININLRGPFFLTKYFLKNKKIVAELLISHLQVDSMEGNFKYTMQLLKLD